MSTYRVKICGVCCPEDAQLASEAGADYIGVLVDVPNTPRSRTLEQAQAVAAAASVPLVLLLWEPRIERAKELASHLRPFAIQLLADETPDDLRAIKRACGCQVWKAVHLPARGTGEVDVDTALAEIESYEAAGADGIVLDAKAVVDGRERRGGTGQATDWDAAAEIIRRSRLPVLLAGGINPENVAAAVQATRPFAVDLSTGAESEKCRKDPAKVRAIIERVRAIEQARSPESQ